MNICLKRKIYIKTFFIFFFLLSITSCQKAIVDPLKLFETPIISINAKNIVRLAENRATELNDDEILFLNQLKYLKQDKNEYIKEMKGGDLSSQQLEEHFINNQKQAFSLLKKNKVTLNKMFDFIKIKKERLAPLNINTLYKKIDRYNSNIQQKIDDVRIKEIEKLNKQFSMKLIEVEEAIPSEQQRWTSAYTLSFEIENKLHEDSTGYTYIIIFTDSEGNEIGNYFKNRRTTKTETDENGKNYSLPATINDEGTVGITYTRAFACLERCWKQTQASTDAYNVMLEAYSKYDRDGIPFYINAKVLTLRTKTHSYPDFGDLNEMANLKNTHYSSPDILNGVGPYTMFNQVLVNEKKALDIEIKKTAETYRNSIPILYEFENLIQSLKEIKTL